MFKKRPQTTDPAIEAQAAAFPALGTTLPHPDHLATGGGFGIPSSLGATAMTQAKPRTSKPKRSWRKIAKRTFIALLIIGILIGGYVGVKVIINTGKAFDGNVFGLFQHDKLNGEDEGRVNILLAGNSADDPGHGGADLTDSIMIASIDTKHHTAFMISVPRDLWVELPTGGYQKINAVYKFAEDEGFHAPGYPSGGMGALEQVISQNFGLELHYYALINYTAFRDAVNAVGGIDVTITSSDPRGLYDAMISRADGGPLRLANGPQHLDGQTALNLARARGSGYSYGYARGDFTRTEHQRLMLLALKNKASNASVLANPVKLGSLLDSFGSNVTSNFQTSEVRRLYEISQEIPDSAVTSVGLNDVDGKNLLTGYNGRGTSALIPAAGVDDYSDIQAYIQTLLAPPPNPEDTTSGSSQ